MNNRNTHFKFQMANGKGLWIFALCILPFAFVLPACKKTADTQNTAQAGKALQNAALLLKKTPNHLLRGVFQDQSARYAGDSAQSVAALQHWKNAEKEFDLNMKSWSDEQKQRFQENSLAWQEHRIIYTLLRAKLN